MMRLRRDVLVLIGVGLLNSAICSAVLVGPPCNQQAAACFENAKCDTDTNVCVCDKFFVMSGDWTKCLPVAATPYESACEEDGQCSARMRQGAICSAGNCVCKDGFHYLHGICHKSSGYGEICDHDDDCYGAFSYESMSCSENKCGCSDGYYLVGRSYCRRKGKVGEECVFDMDCRFEGGYCNASICAVKDQRDERVLSSTGNSLFQNPEDLNTESPTIKLGDACETSDECLVATNNSECYGKICVCELGYSNFTGVCQPDLGEFCSEAGDLDYIDYAECRGSVTRCKAPYIITENNRICRIGRLYGDQCQVPEQCRFSGDHAECIAVGNRNLCRCAAGYHFVDELNLCLETKGVGQLCDHSYECAVTSGNVHCVNSTCACLEGFHETRGDCVRDVEALNDPCLDTSDCISVIASSSCISGICQCNRGYFADTTTNTSCLVGIAGPCADDCDCKAVKSSFCNVAVCACNNSTIATTENNVCLKVAEVFGEECEEDAQCYRALGSEGSVCIEGKCACKENYHFRNQLCRKKRVLGEPCEQNSQCYLASNETHRVECRNGLCQCGYKYTQTEDLDCKSGVSGQSASFEFVIGALIGVLLRQTKWN